MLKNFKRVLIILLVVSLVGCVNAKTYTHNLDINLKVGDNVSTGDFAKLGRADDYLKVNGNKVFDASKFGFNLFTSVHTGRVLFDGLVKDGFIPKNYYRTGTVNIHVGEPVYTDTFHTGLFGGNKHICTFTFHINT